MHRFHYILISVLVFGLVVTIPVNVMGQETVVLKKIKVSFEKTPEYDTKPSQKSPREKYIQILGEYTTSAPWLDEIEIEYFLLAKPKDASIGSYLLLKGKGKYINIKQGKHLCSAFIHPKTTDRYIEQPMAAAVAIKIDKKIVGFMADKMSRTQWLRLTEKAQPIEEILNRRQSPYVLFEPELYEMMKPIAE